MIYLIFKKNAKPSDLKSYIDEKHQIMVNNAYISQYWDMIKSGGCADAEQKTVLDHLASVDNKFPTRIITDSLISELAEALNNEVSHFKGRKYTSKEVKRIIEKCFNVEKSKDKNKHVVKKIRGVKLQCR